MSTTVTPGAGAAAAERRAGGGRPTRPAGSTRIAGRYNWLGGLTGWLWLLVVILPIYWIAVTSLKSQADYFVTRNASMPTL